MEFYHSILGGDLTIQTFGEAGMAKSDEEKDYIMHAELKTGSFSLMASSGRPEEPVKFGDSISLSLNGSDSDLLSGYFKGLSDGGTVLMPLEKQFGETHLGC